jgi:hypothetical protein
MTGNKKGATIKDQTIFFRRPSVLSPESLAPSVSASNNADLSRVNDKPVPVLLPERFRASCAFGAHQPAVSLSRTPFVAGNILLITLGKYQRTKMHCDFSYLVAASC